MDVGLIYQADMNTSGRVGSDLSILLILINILHASRSLIGYWKHTLVILFWPPLAMVTIGSLEGADLEGEILEG